MKILIHDKNVDLTPQDRQYCQEKLLKLVKHIKREPTVCEAHFELTRAQVTLHITLLHPQEKLPDHYDETGKTVPEVIDLVKDRIEKHLRRKRSK